MSVWFTETIKGQLLWDWAKLGAVDKDTWEKLAAKTDIVFNGGTLRATAEFPEIRYPTGTAVSMLAAKDDLGFRDIFFDRVKENTFKGKNGHVTRYLADKYPTFKTGLPAVYALYRKFNPVMIKHSATNDNRTRRYILDFMEQAFRGQVGIMKNTPKKVAEAYNRLNLKALELAALWHVAAKRFRAMSTFRWCGASFREQKGKFRDAPRSFHDASPFQFPDDWLLYFDGWVTYLDTNDDDDGAIYALTSADLDRLQQMFVSRGMLELHRATWCITPGNDADEYDEHYRAITRIFERAIDHVVQHTDTADPASLCKYMRKAFNAYLSMAAGELSDEGTAKMLADTDEGKRTFNANLYIATLASMPFDLAQDLGRIYKLLPAPDYDLGEAYVARQKQHLATNGYDPTPEGDPNPCNYDEFRQYMRRLAIVTLSRSNGGKGVGKFGGTAHKIPQWFREYQQTGTMPDDLSLVDLVDLRGVAPYVERTPESVTAWKDSAVCEESMQAAMEEGSNLFNRRNMLLRFLTDRTCPTEDSARIKLTRPTHIHRVGYKMEAHKPVARLFFIGNMQDRLIQSEMEENVHRVALNCPGYMIGQTPEYSRGKIMSMVAPRLGLDETVHYFNFDISAWSPGMRGDIQRISHEIWAEIFDREEFLHAHQINERSKIILNKRGYQGVYENPEANLEGYNGKEMTFLHCALMGYSVYRYRRASGHRLSVSLCAYIDDGLATFKDTKEFGSTRFLQFSEIVEDTYKRLGFLLERSKCYMSTQFAIFLNEIYFCGRHITYGLRAIMRVGTQAFEAHETLSQRANAYFSGTQGAIRAGLDPLAGVLVYYWLLANLMLMYDSAKFLDARAAVLYCFTPRPLGGLGSQNFVGTASNLSADSLSEGISTMQELAKAYPDYTTKVTNIIRQKVVVRDTTGILLTPSSYPDSKVELVESRMRNAIAKALRKTNLTARAKSFMHVTSSADLKSLAEGVIESSAVVNASLFDDIISSTPYAILLALIRKFESARTMASLVGRRVMREVVRRNRVNAVASMQCFITR
jgi:hypothetical protein